MRARDRGFTLIEVLVAVAIFSMVTTALYRGLSLGWRGQRVAEREAAALNVAKNKLASAGYDSPLEEGTQSGETDAGIAWSSRVSPYAPAGGDAKEGTLTPFWVHVTVTWEEAPARPLKTLELRTLKLARRK